MTHLRRGTARRLVAASGLGATTILMLAAAEPSFGTARTVAASSAASTLSAASLPLNRAIGINLIGGWPGEQTPSVTSEIQDAAQNLHVSWVRWFADWWRIDPSLVSGSGSGYSWGPVDTAMAAAAKYGVGMLAMIGSPDWQGSTMVIPTATQWTAFVTAFVQRYDSVWKPEGLTLIVEPWNEPDQGQNWTAGASTFMTQIQLPAYNAVKAVDSSVLVHMATTDFAAGGGHSFWQTAVTAAAGKPFVDLPGYHDYANLAGTWAGQMRSFLQSNGVKYTAIWNSEFGAAGTDSVHISVLQSHIPQTRAGTGPDATFYYAYKDLAEGPSGGPWTVHASYGLMNENGNHYGSYSVFQQLMTGTSPPQSAAPPTAVVSSPPVSHATPTPSATASASSSATAATSTPTAGTGDGSPPAPTPSAGGGATAGRGTIGGGGLPLAVYLGTAGFVVIGGGLLALGLVPSLRRWPPRLRS